MPSADNLFFAERGAGPPLVCVHGAGGNHTHWGYLLAGLAAGARVLAVDLPGHGRSAPPALTAVAEYGAALLALLDALGLEQARFVGHSMGAAAALEAAIAAPERVAGLALLGASARLRVAPAFLAGLVDDPPATVKSLVAAMYPEAPPELRAAAAAEYERDPALLRAGLAACDGWDARARLAPLAAPALVVCGQADLLTPPRLAGELADLLGAPLTLLPHVGHVPMIEAPAATLAALQAWLEPAG